MNQPSRSTGQFLVQVASQPHVTCYSRCLRAELISNALAHHTQLRPTKRIIAQVVNSVNSRIRAVRLIPWQLSVEGGKAGGRGLADDRTDVGEQGKLCVDKNVFILKVAANELHLANYVYF